MNQLELTYRPTFDGGTYDKRLDQARLTGQLLRVFGAMLGGKWWTLEELRAACGGTTQSLSARVRDLRKPRFGAYTIERRRCTAGCWEYRLVT